MPMRMTFSVKWPMWLGQFLASTMIVFTGISAPAFAAERYDFIAVGGGYAGVRAAYELQKRGKKVLVLESSEKAAGRTSTIQLGGMTQSLGAQFLIGNDGYRDMLNLIAELGLSGDLVTLSPYSSTLSDHGDFRQVDRFDPLSTYNQGLIGAKHANAGLMYLFQKNPFTAWMSHDPGTTEERGRIIVAAVEDVYAATRHLPLDDIRGWEKFDDGETAREWMLRYFTAYPADMIAEPLIRALYFQDSTRISKAFLFWLIANGDHARSLRPGRYADWYVMRNGTGAVVEAMARALGDRVLVNAEVLRGGKF